MRNPRDFLNNIYLQNRIDWRGKWRNFEVDSAFLDYIVLDGGGGIAICRIWQ